MPSVRIQRRIDTLLDEADEAYSSHQWEISENRARTALGLDPENQDALAILAAIGRMTDGQSSPATDAPDAQRQSALPVEASTPTSFSDGRYQARRHLGEGGKKMVYLAGDTLLDVDSHRVLSMLPHGIGESDVAAEYDKDALGSARCAGYHPELAWSLHDSSDMLAQRGDPGDQQKATSMLERGPAILHRSGHASLMERVLSRRDILKA